VTVRPIELGRHGSDLPLDIGYSTLKLAPKPSEGLLHGAYRHVLIESALIVLAFYRLCGDPTAAFFQIRLSGQRPHRLGGWRDTG
jgi:hypothetical protein